MTFDEWIASVFDHPATKPEAYWDLDADFWEGPAATIVDYLTRTFAQADVVLQPFSDAQVGQGLYAITGNGPTEYPFALLDTSVPLSLRLDCIGAMTSLFERCFARRCTPVLSDLNEPGGGPLNTVCYMWWDHLPLHGLSRHRPDHPDGSELDKAVLAAIQDCLEIDSVVCHESALHGLDEWSPYYDGNAVIDAFLRQHPDIRPELRSYAMRVKSGKEAPPLT